MWRKKKMKNSRYYKKGVQDLLCTESAYVYWYYFKKYTSKNVLKEHPAMQFYSF